MPVFLAPLKRPLLLPFLSKPIFSSSTPTHEDVAHLILHQTTPAQALQTFRWAARLPSFRHNPTTYAALIRSLASFRRLDDAQKILLDEIPSATGSPPDDATILALVQALARSRNPRGALKVLDLISSRFGILYPPLKILNSVLDALVKDDIDLARDFFRTKITPRGGDEHTFGILMKGLCRTNRIAEGFKLLKLMKSSRRLPPNPVIYNTLIHALCRNGKVGRGRSLMAEMESPSSVTFNILISAYCGEGNLVQSLVMLEKSFDLGLVPDTIAVTKIIELLCSQDRAMEAVEILERVEKRGGAVDVVAYNTLIKGFCGMEKPQSGLRVLREMESKGRLPNVHTYNSLIAGFCDSRNLDSAIDLFREMRTDGINPDNTTFETLVRGFCSVGRVEDGLKVLGTMEEERGGHGERINPYNSILYGFYKDGRLEEAYEFLNSMKSSFPRAVERTLRILGLCNEGKVGEAKLVFDRMITEGDAPSAIVYRSLIEGLCDDEGSVREAFDLMNEMMERGFFPVVSTFNALIHGFCREGKFRSAARLVEEMVGRGCSPNAASYNPLIGGLCGEGDFERAFGLLVQMVERDVIPDQSTWNSLLQSGALWGESKIEIQINEVVICSCLKESLS